MNPEELFNATKLDMIVPEEVHDLPDVSDVDDWLRSHTSHREKAFFGESTSLDKLFT